MSLQTNKGRHFLVAYLRPFWPQLLCLFTLLCASICLDLVNPQIIRTFIDTISSQGSQSTLFLAAGAFSGVVLCGQVISVVEAYMAENVQQRTTNTLRVDLLQHCLHLDFPFYQTHMPGELIERIETDISALGNFLSRFVTSILANVLLLIGILLIFYTIDWRIGLSLTLYTFLAFGVLHVIRAKSQIGTAWHAERQASADLQGFLEESISGAEDIRTSGAIVYSIQRFYSYSRRAVATLRRAMMATVLVMQSMGILSLLGTTLALGIGIFLFQARTITIGTVYLIFSYSMLLNRPIQQLNMQLQDGQRAFASIGRVNALLALQSAITSGTSQQCLEDKALSCEFRDVSFHYTPDAPVLKHLSFSLQPGQVLGLLGRTGSGKTTITRLINRFYDPSSGSILLGGVDLRELNLAELQRHIGIVTQDVHIFHASVRDNLSLFDPHVPDERIIQALEDVGMGDWYRTLPAGLDTQLLSAEGLSVGEEQLLAFARVFLKNPRLVILDEASSYLDPLTEQRLVQAINRLLAGRTALVIAHRLTTLERADVLLVLADGQCQEFGERQLLLADQSSRYAQLLRVGLEGALQ
jgi:ABC-type multidrug transport system fused ATPase/permease subunit